MEPYKTFLVTFDSTKLNLFIGKNPIKNKGKYIAIDDEEGPKKS